MPQAQSMDSPQHRKRRSLTPKPVFTISMAGPNIQHRSLNHIRILFTLQILSGLACLLCTTLLSKPGPAVFWPLTGISLFLLTLSFITRLRLPWFQLLSFILGICCTGFVVGFSLVPEGRNAFNTLLHPVLLIGLPLLGYTLWGLISSTPYSFKGIFFTGSWILLAFGLVWFFPSGEWNLGSSGLLGLLFLFCLQRATLEAKSIYRPNESWMASADVLPLAVLALLKLFSGRE
jgi:hypothetical protein